MSAFPQARTLIVRPSKWHSRGKTVTLVSGEAANASRYPLTALTDGSAGAGAFKFAPGSVTGSLRVNLATGNTVTPNIFGVAGHNFDRDQIINVQGSANASMSPLVVNKGFAVRQPTCWIDLRAYAAQVDYWQLNFQNTSHPPILGELIVATGDLYEGVLAPNPKESITANQTRGQLEGGQTVISAAGSILRALPTTLRLSADEQTQLADTFDEVAASGDVRIVMVPDSRRNDLWLVEWPRLKQFLYADAYAIATVDLSLVEEAFGAY